MQKQYTCKDGKLIQVHDRSGQIMVFINPDNKEKEFLVQDMRLDEHTLQSALDRHELSRMEFEPSHAAVIFKRPKSYKAGEQLELEVVSVGAFLFKDRLLIVVGEEDIELFNGIQLNRDISLREVLLRMIYRSIYHFLEHLKVINRISDELQDKINISMKNKYLIDLFGLQKSLVYYQSSINSNGSLIEKMKNNIVKLELSGEEQEYLDDIFIENKQCYRLAEINSNILASLMDARVSIVSNNLNILIKFLNIITIAIMVPTFVVSAFSMNVPLPLQGVAGAFWIILGMAAVSVMGFMLYYRYKKW